MPRRHVTLRGLVLGGLLMLANAGWRGKGKKVVDAVEHVVLDMDGGSTITAQDVFDFLVFKKPFSLEICMFGYLIWVSSKVRKMGKLYWLESLVRTVLMSFGGGFFVPMLLGKFAFPFVNEAAITLTLCAWWLTHYCPGDVVFTLFESSKVIRCLCAFLFECMRTFVYLNWTRHAFNLLPRSLYYPVPFWGPIICGTLAGSFGQFLPGDKGLVAIRSEVNWLVQSAFYGTCYFYFSVYNPHTRPVLISIYQSLGLGGYDIASDPMCHATIVIANGLILVLQEAVLGHDFNPLGGVHYVLYRFTNIPQQQKPKLD